MIDMYTYVEVTSEGTREIGYAQVKFNDEKMILTFSNGLGITRMKFNLDDIGYVAEGQFIGGNTFTLNADGYRITLYEDGLATSDYLRNYFKYLSVQV
ncbi:hypothetical protein GBO89_03890 [Pediococcus pentosaceus]|nr:hypothetical protein GBO69_03620 [Pediococcus pentosaceus]KAF0434676.1 hypothetical protein GBO89_03890 [Pediococcus pentosaceus]KAF0443015.1 hypothetical protein GBO92_03390 [Pediococcus pentosaceus]MBF7108446.1 hypothetical protein [Pediococcus pentosaceus]